MNKLIRIPLLLTLVATLLSINAYAQSHENKEPAPAATPEAPKPILDLGQLDGTSYTNSFFDLSLSIPANWLAMEQEKRDTLDSAVKKVIQTPDQQRQTKIEESVERTRTLLRVTKLPLGQPQNAQVMLVAERLPAPLKTGLEVIEVMKQTMQGTNFNIEFLDTPHNETLGGAEFWRGHGKSGFAVWSFPSEDLHDCA